MIFFNMNNNFDLIHTMGDRYHNRRQLYRLIVSNCVQSKTEILQKSYAFKDYIFY